MSVLLAGIVADTARWLTDPARWRGEQGIPNRLLQHVGISAAVLLIALSLALPLGLWLGHRGRGANAVVALANVARAVPSFGLIVLGVVAFGIGVGPVIAALVVLAVPPILVNTSTAIREVDADLKEAARGQGLSEVQVLRQVELPAAIRSSWPASARPPSWWWPPPPWPPWSPAWVASVPTSSTGSASRTGPRRSGVRSSSLSSPP